jgi:hypothetical protein
MGGPRSCAWPAAGTWRGVVALGCVTVIATTVGQSTATGRGGPAAHHATMIVVGNMEPYPDLHRAGRRAVSKARNLLRASRRTAHRFDTLTEAKRLGYKISRWLRPGLTHVRKNDRRFWGRVFDARAPQALVFWCPARGRCTLTAYMYRAPAGKPPSTWNKLLQWHRHDDTRTATWITHVWLVKHTREGFATCAPAEALRTALGIRLPRHYRAIKHDQPCPRRGEAPGGEHSPPH